MKSPYKKERKLLTDFYMWMVENKYDHNIRIRVETKAELFMREQASTPKPPRAIKKALRLFGVVDFIGQMTTNSEVKIIHIILDCVLL
jgi:hypothetical protein